MDCALLPDNAHALAIEIFRLYVACINTEIKSSFSFQICFDCQWFPVLPKKLISGSII